MDNLDLRQFPLCDILGKMCEWLLFHTHRHTPKQYRLPSHSAAGESSFNLPFNLTSVALLDPRQSYTYIPFVSHTESFYNGIWSYYLMLLSNNPG
jgi:hypothetical protein